MKNKILNLIILLVIITCPLLALADPGTLPGGGDVTDTGAPIDGGLTLLAVSGIGYGIKKIRIKNTSKNWVKNK